MKKILCPTDFSATAHNAIAYAAKLAQATNSELTLLNVQSLFDLTPAEIVKGRKPTLEAAAAALEAQSMEVAKTFKISCYADVESTYSNLSRVINHKAEQHDLIVMGSNGPDDLYEFLTGSNTYNAIIKSKTPLLLIPEGYLYSEIKSIVYAFDYLHERKIPFDQLITFINSLKCKLTILQVLDEVHDEELEEDLDDLQSIMKNFFGQHILVKYDTIRSSNVADGIDRYILKNQSDALALCAIHRNLAQRIFHKSVIKHISVVCSYPVFVFHP